jgi:predicted ATPase
LLRECAEVVEAFTVDRLLILILEDLHWSDHATLDLITWLARRREPARLLVLGTYRPVDVIVHGHPLQAVHQDHLALHGQCADLHLEDLTAAEVATYVGVRFPTSTAGPRAGQRALSAHGRPSAVYGTDRGSVASPGLGG